MGIETDSNGNSVGSAFSRDVLRVEISGPNEDHLTVIDVPGMFENETPGQTTKADIDLVKSMVKKYINESRTIILAVVPCNGDIANQKILTYAKEADPEGKRTLGVLTKPDLAVEQATKGVVVDLVLGKRRDLQLGYCVVKNRGADDTSSSPEDRNLQERSFFTQAPWTKLPADRIGIPALKTRLGQLLMDRTKSEFPKVRSELSVKLKEHESDLKSMGQSRSTEAEQRIYVGNIAAQFAQIKNYGLDAYYTRHKIFENEDLKLITRIREINEGFGKVLYEKGHTRKFFEYGKERVSEPFETDDTDDGISDATSQEDHVKRGDLYSQMTFAIPLLGESDLMDDILYDPYCCSQPQEEDILTYIEKEYLTSRGYEIGTVSSFQPKNTPRLTPSSSAARWSLSRSRSNLRSGFPWLEPTSPTLFSLSTTSSVRFLTRVVRTNLSAINSGSSFWMTSRNATVVPSTMSSSCLKLSSRGRVLRTIPISTTL